jgi:hypothetical protein
VLAAAARLVGHPAPAHSYYFLIVKEEVQRMMTLAEDTHTEGAVAEPLNIGAIRKPPAEFVGMMEPRALPQSGDVCLA